jgi:class 3 adenylate cyclase
VRDGTSSDGVGETAGVRTFLIADVRGYTRYGDDRGDEAASALARRFAEIASNAVAAGGGEVIELRGDEALCVFASARSAVRGAVETVTVFRCSRETGAASSGAPHALQKRAPSGFSCPQLAQTRTSASLGRSGCDH